MEVLQNTQGRVNTLCRAFCSHCDTHFAAGRVAIKVGKACANKVGMGLEDGAMEQDDGVGFWVWRVAEVVNVSIRAEAADDGNMGWDLKGAAAVCFGPPHAGRAFAGR